MLSHGTSYLNGHSEQIILWQALGATSKSVTCLLLEWQNNGPLKEQVTQRALFFSGCQHNPCRLEIEKQQQHEVYGNAGRKNNGEVNGISWITLYFHFHCVSHKSSLVSLAENHRLDMECWLSTTHTLETVTLKGKQRKYCVRCWILIEKNFLLMWVERCESSFFELITESWQRSNYRDANEPCLFLSDVKLKVVEIQIKMPALASCQVG